MGGAGRSAAGRPALRVSVAMVACVAALCVLSARSSAAQMPLAVRSATLMQSGRRLRFTVTLNEPLLSSRIMRSQHRSLCLLLERRRSGRPFAQVCLAPPGRRHSGARLRLAAVNVAGAVGPSHAIAARITRPSSHVLSATFRPASVGIGYRTLRWQVASALAPPACVPAGAGTGEAAAKVAAGGPGRAGSGDLGQPRAGEGGGCLGLYPARPRLVRLHTPRLVGCTPSASSPIFEGPSAKHEIALTFDDGPWNDPPTMDFVNLLARYHVPATFFEIGSQISEYDPTGAIERQMLLDGDMIGDHTWTHPDMVTLPEAEQRSQLELTARAIKRATGFTPCLWRPPYGDISPQLDSLAGSLRLSTVLWNVDPRDWALPGVASIETNVLSNARNGAIVDMHFGGGPRQQTLAALPHIITTLRRSGYRLVTVTKLLGLRLIYR